jgi:hypothetical protein
METKAIKLHGMSSEKASRVKVRGHRKEDIFANIIKGLVIKGTKKQDVINSYEQWFSVKGGSEVKGSEGREGRWSIILYSKSRIEEETDFPARDIFLDILGCYPKTHAEYEATKTEVKKNVAVQMRKLKDYLLDETNRTEFLDRSFFNRKINFFVVYHDDVFHIFEKDEAWQTFLKNLKVETNSSDLKVVFKDDGLCGEIEVRTTDDGKYPSIMFTMSKLSAFGLLSKKISKIKKLSPVLWLYGKAIGKYKYDKTKS